VVRRALESLAWLRAHPVSALVVLAAFVAGSISGAPAGEQLFRYTWTDADFCDDCHVHDYANEAWARSVHAGLTTCHDCHRVPIRHYPKNLWTTVFDPPEGEEDIHPPDVANVVCEQCHAEAGLDEVLTGPMRQDVRRRIVKIDDSPGHRRHLDSETRHPGAYRGGDEPDSRSEEPITCMDCHGAESNRAHRFESSSKNCVECHEDQEMMAGKPLNCRECHFEEFLGGLPAGDAAASPP